MPTVHVFSSLGRFGSFEAIRSFVDPKYTEDGDVVPSPFMSEVQLCSFAPACVEVVWVPRACPLPELLREVSYASQWLVHVDTSLIASEAICVFAPNEPERPAGTSLHYCGGYVYDTR